jgi:hypothetical protein
VTLLREPLSPGIAYGCFELMAILCRSSIHTTAAATLGRLGVVSAGRAIECARALEWISEDPHGILRPSERGFEVNTIERTDLRLRAALIDMVKIHDPTWLQNARSGRRRFLKFAPPEIAQLCREAGLEVVTDTEVVAFWDCLAARARGFRDVQLNEVGREGERLTIEYEYRRTGRAPKWIAIESNQDGYDVLSSIGPNDLGPLYIEVKASRLGKHGDFYMSRSEWEQGRAFTKYTLYLWDVSTIIPKIAIVSCESLHKHIPKDMGDGRWETAKIPFQIFDREFREYPPK